MSAMPHNMDEIEFATYQANGQRVRARRPTSKSRVDTVDGPRLATPSDWILEKHGYRRVVSNETFVTQYERVPELDTEADPNSVPDLREIEKDVLEALEDRIDEGNQYHTSRRIDLPYTNKEIGKALASLEDKLSHLQMDRFSNSAPITWHIVRADSEEPLGTADGEE